MKSWHCRAIFLIMIGLAFCRQLHATPQVCYDTSAMPRIDLHSHLWEGSASEYAFMIEEMDKWGGALMVDLDGSNSDIAMSKNSFDGRILCCRSDYDLSSMSWTPSSIAADKAIGYIGYKMTTNMGNNYLPDNSYLNAVLAEMATHNMPAICMHVGIKPEDGGDHWGYVQSGLHMINKYPNTTFIMAHGFWLMTTDSDLDSLITYLDRYPNLNIELSAVTQYWQAHEVGGKTYGVTYEKIRNFMIDYKDRILYGSDTVGDDGYYYWFKERQRYETDMPLTAGFDSGLYPGLNLPLDVLNHIWFWNATRLIPNVTEALENLGYQIGDEPPHAVSSAYRFSVEGPVGPAALGSSHCTKDRTILYGLFRPACVELTIYSLDGRLLSTVFVGKKAMGRHTISVPTHTSTGALIPAGRYLFRLTNDLKAGQGKGKLFLVR